MQEHVVAITFVMAAPLIIIILLRRRCSFYEDGKHRWAITVEKKTTPTWGHLARELEGFPEKDADKTYGIKPLQVDLHRKTCACGRTKTVW